MHVYISHLDTPPPASPPPPSCAFIRAFEVACAAFARNPASPSFAHWPHYNIFLMMYSAAQILYCYQVQPVPTFREQIGYKTVCLFVVQFHPWALDRSYLKFLTRHGGAR